MDKQIIKRAKDAPMMNEDIIDIFLTREPFCKSSQATLDHEPKLGRFIYDRESGEQPHLIGSGKHGIVPVLPKNRREIYQGAATKGLYSTHLCTRKVSLF